jgi:hypothetical protein
MDMEPGTKFIGINPNVNTVEKKSAQANSIREVYTIEDIRGGYKSFAGYFTADTVVVSYESLTIGDEYIIVDNSAGGDFTGVGAPNNDNGTIFTATGSDPNWGGNPTAILVDLTQSKYGIVSNFNSLGFEPELEADLLSEPSKAIVGINFPYEVDYNKIFVNIPKFGELSLSYTVDQFFDIIIFDVYPAISKAFNYPIEIRIYE